MLHSVGAYTTSDKCPVQKRLWPHDLGGWNFTGKPSILDKDTIENRSHELEITRYATIQVVDRLTLMQQVMKNVIIYFSLKNIVLDYYWSSSCQSAGPVPPPLYIIDFPLQNYCYFIRTYINFRDECASNKKENVMQMVTIHVYAVNKWFLAWWKEKRNRYHQLFNIK